ncbi:unnamed protein product [Bemisia tabaci]|uniref:BTB domain-containing protein n=1 Tax=Bemisia tabaci TaxID=7038 RepID=A0A9P0AFH3_BEMTA|nr:unnamed protein product [Bemisia tabaci]
MSSHHTSQRFCLRWNNHQSNLLSVFDQLLHDESFVDVTLAVEGQFLKAHKMVLSACSPYFQALFTGHPDKHPIVILKDVPFADMRSLLDFMYRGEVSVDQDRLTAFLKVAETLRIKGLTEVNEERCDLPSIASSLLSSAGFTQGTQPSSQQQQQQQQRQEQQQSQPPSLHRIHVPTKRSLQNSMASNPLLGSALTAPKRKRGRPRRLSGSDEHRNQSHKSSTDSEDQRHDDDSDAPSSGVHGPPDLLEVNMPDYHHSPPSRLSQSDTSPPPSEDSTPIGNDSDQPSSKVKPEFEEPTPGTSQQESGGGSQSPKSSSQDSESKLPSGKSATSFVNFIFEIVLINTCLLM